MSRTLGRYELVRPLARGGMAEVYLARRRVAGVEKRVVIKRIRQERARDPRFLAMFVREARVSMALAHQNIVPTFDFGRADDALFLAMEHVEGRDLGVALALSCERGAPPAPLLAAFIAAECCRALDYAHGRRGPEGTPLGVVHRDLAPKNVLLSWNGEVKLADFGVAALVGDADGVMRGTPAYMAPEQAHGQTVDPRSDLFALGLVLWEMLAGRRCRDGADLAAVLAQARAATVAALPAATPPALVAVVERATAAAPAGRHPDARAMLGELDRYIVGERAAQPTLPSPEVMLSAWLATLWPGGEEAGLASADGLPGHDAPAVTFLDDGEGSVLAGATVRSLAATMADGRDGARVEAQAADDLADDDPPARPRPRAGGLALVALVLVASASVGAWAFWRREPVPRADGEADAATVVAATVDAAAPVAAPDDVPTPTAPTDAAVAMVVVAVDAGTARGDGARRDAGSHHVPPPSALPAASATHS